MTAEANYMWENGLLTALLSDGVRVLHALPCEYRLIEKILLASKKTCSAIQLFLMLIIDYFFTGLLTGLHVRSALIIFTNDLKLLNDTKSCSSKT